VGLSNLLQRTRGLETREARRALLERSIALNGDFAPSQLALSSVLMQMGLFHQALPPALRAVELDPGRVNGRTTLASALARTGKIEEALAEARTAMSLARTDAERRSVQITIDSIERLK
jgi:tetratricopeptide (TPR) repeat protein